MALAPNESLPLLIQFMADGRSLEAPRTGDLTIFTDQGAAFGGDGAAFLFQLRGVQMPEPGSLAVWAMLGGGAMLGFRSWRRRSLRCSK